MINALENPLKNTIGDLVVQFREKLARKFQEEMGDNWYVEDFRDRPNMIYIAKPDWFDDEYYIYYEIGSSADNIPDINYRGLGISLKKFFSKGNLYQGNIEEDENNENIKNDWREIKDKIPQELYELFNQIVEKGKQVWNITDSDFEKYNPFSWRCIFEPVYPDDLKLQDNLESLRKILPENVDQYVNALYEDLIPFIRETEQIVDQIVAYRNR